jgi:hypothetical protein
MKIARNMLFAFAFAVLGFQPGHATPPRYASVHDAPVGINETHMFAFRILGDNKGSHYISVTQRFLIAQNLDTGIVDHIWPLDQTRETFVEVDQQTFEYQRADPKIDPLDILAKFSAAPLTIGARSTWSDDHLQFVHLFELRQEGIIDTRTGEIATQASEIEARIAASMVPFMDFLPDDPGPIDPLTFDADAFSRELADCFVIEVFANTRSYETFRLECENGEFEVLSYVIYLTIPRKN